jgi:prepilin signal peptidase PulO-like enzyme (type II secretory pathway)
VDVLGRALGAWGGPRYCADVAVLSIVLGGLMAIALLAWKGALFGTLSKLFRFVRSVAVPGLELELPQADRRHTMPYGVPIAAAAVWVAWADPLQAWGLRPW